MSLNKEPDTNGHPRQWMGWLAAIVAVLVLAVAIQDAVEDHAAGLSAATVTYRVAMILLFVGVWAYQRSRPKPNWDSALIAFALAALAYM